jgi:hypothetical protein
MESKKCTQGNQWKFLYMRLRPPVAVLERGVKRRYIILHQNLIGGILS